MDELDIAEMNESLQRDNLVQNVRNAALNIPIGEPGECFYCGETFSRLINKACGRCRDARKLP